MAAEDIRNLDEDGEQFRYAQTEGMQRLYSANSGKVDRRIAHEIGIITEETWQKIDKEMNGLSTAAAGQDTLDRRRATDETLFRRAKRQAKREIRKSDIEDVDLDEMAYWIAFDRVYGKFRLEAPTHEKLAEDGGVLQKVYANVLAFSMDHTGTDYRAALKVIERQMGDVLDADGANAAAIQEKGEIKNDRISIRADIEQLEEDNEIATELSQRLDALGRLNLPTYLSDLDTHAVAFGENEQRRVDAESEITATLEPEFNDASNELPTYVARISDFQANLSLLEPHIAAANVDDAVKDNLRTEIADISTGLDRYIANPGMTDENITHADWTTFIDGELSYFVALLSNADWQPVSDANPGFGHLEMGFRRDLRYFKNRNHAFVLRYEEAEKNLDDARRVVAECIADSPVLHMTLTGSILEAFDAMHELELFGQDIANIKDDRIEHFVDDNLRSACNQFTADLVAFKSANPVININTAIAYAGALRQFINAEAGTFLQALELHLAPALNNAGDIQNLRDQLAVLDARFDDINQQNGSYFARMNAPDLQTARDDLQSAQDEAKDTENVLNGHKSSRDNAQWVVNKHEKSKTSINEDLEEANKAIEEFQVRQGKVTEVTEAKEAFETSASEELSKANEDLEETRQRLEEAREMVEEARTLVGEAEDAAEEKRKVVASEERDRGVKEIFEDLLDRVVEVAREMVDRANGGIADADLGAFVVEMDTQLITGFRTLANQEMIGSHNQQYCQSIVREFERVRASDGEAWDYAEVLRPVGTVVNSIHSVWQIRREEALAAADAEVAQAQQLLTDAEQVVTDAEANLTEMQARFDEIDREERLRVLRLRGLKDSYLSDLNDHDKAVRDATDAVEDFETRHDYAVAFIEYAGEEIPLIEERIEEAKVRLAEAEVIVQGSQEDLDKAEEAVRVVETRIHRLENPEVEIVEEALPGVQVQHDGTLTLNGFAGRFKDAVAALEDAKKFFDTAGSVRKIRKLATEFETSMQPVGQSSFRASLLAEEIDGDTLTAQLGQVNQSLAALRSLRTRNQQEMKDARAQRGRLENLRTQLDTAHKACVALHKGLEPFIDHLKTAQMAGIVVQDADGEEIDISAIIKAFEGINIKGHFNPAEIQQVYAGVQRITGDPVVLDAFVKSIVKTTTQLSRNVGMTDEAFAEKILKAILTKRFPDWDDMRRSVAARKILKRDATLFQLKGQHRELAKEASPEVLRTAEIAGFRRMVIDFRYEVGDKDHQPFKKMKPSVFENWAGIEKELKLGRIDHNNGFFLLAALEELENRQYAEVPEDVRPISIQRERLKAALFEKLARAPEFNKGGRNAFKRLHEAGVRDIVQQAFDARLAKAKSMMTTHFENYDNNVDTWQMYKLAEIEKKLEALFERYKRGTKHGGISDELFQKEYEAIMREARNYDLEDQLKATARNATFAQAWNSPEAQWLKDLSWNLGSLGLRKTGSVLLSTAGVGIKGTWGFVKTSAKATVLGPFLAARYPVLLAAKGAIGTANLGRRILKKDKWNNPINIKEAVKADVDLIAGEAKGNWEGAKKAFGKYGDNWKEAGGYKSTKYHERSKKDPKALKEEAEEFRDKGETDDIELTADPFPDLEATYGAQFDQLAKLLDTKGPKNDKQK